MAHSLTRSRNQLDCVRVTWWTTFRELRAAKHCSYHTPEQLYKKKQYMHAQTKTTTTNSIAQLQFIPRMLSKKRVHQKCNYTKCYCVYYRKYLCIKKKKSTCGKALNLTGPHMWDSLKYIWLNNVTFFQCSTQCPRTLKIHIALPNKVSQFTGHICVRIRADAARWIGAWCLDWKNKAQTISRVSLQRCVDWTSRNHDHHRNGEHKLVSPDTPYTCVRTICLNDFLPLSSQMEWTDAQMLS